MDGKCVIASTLLAAVVGGCADGSASTTESATTGAPSICEDEGWQAHDEGGDGAEDTGLGMGDDMPLPLTIAEVQQGGAGPGIWVQLQGVVAVTPAAPSEAIYGRELFVQDPQGGPYSGLRIVAAHIDLGAMLAPGDEVDLVGRVVASEGFVLLQIHSEDDVVRRGAAALPQPTLVAIEDIAPDAPTARQYEGVVVQITDAVVTDDDPCDGEFVLDDAVRVDDRYVPGQIPVPRAGTVVSSVRGVFVRASGSYELAPPELAALE